MFGWKRGVSSLRKEIVLLLVIKLIALSLIWYFCFSGHRDYMYKDQLFTHHIAD